MAQDEQLQGGLIPPTERGLANPVITPDQLNRALHANHALHNALTVPTATGFRRNPLEIARAEQISELAALVSTYNAGQLYAPTMQDYLAAQEATMDPNVLTKQPATPTSSVSVSEAEATLSPIEIVAQNGVQAIIARELAQGRIPEPSQQLATRVGTALSKMLQMLGEDMNHNRQTLLKAVAALPEVEQMVFWNMVGTQRKKTEFSYPDLSYCSSQEMGEYLVNVLWQNHGAELNYGTSFTPDIQQESEISTVLEALADRIEDNGRNGNAPINLYDVMSTLFDDPDHQATSDTFTEKQWATLKRLLQITQGDEALQQLIMQLFAHHKGTRYIIENLEHFGFDDNINKLLDPSLPSQRTRKIRREFGDEQENPDY